MKNSNLRKTYCYWSRRSAMDFGLLAFLFLIFSLEINANYRDKNIDASVKDVLIQNVLTGQVVDENNSPLPGASIVEKGTANGTQSDFDGNFTISVKDKNTILVVSYIGYTTREVVINGQDTINITLTESAAGLDEVVVIGYGTQKKANLTGSVATVSSETLTARPATNSANLLQGRMPGLQVTQPSGQPGRDDPTFQIRGLGSFGASSAPLVLVDGIIGSISNLAPNDIESVTVLKDAASASIYGSRAANGVILVTTKSPADGRIAVDYQMDIGLHNATRLPDFITNSADYMEMYNSAKERSGQIPVYTQEQISAYRNATDRTLYPNFDAVDHYFNQATAINQYLSVSGGNEKSSYKLSLGYLDQDGILPSHDFQRYNTLLNLNSKINDNINIGAIINFSHKNIQEPWLMNDDIVLAVYQHAPTYEPFLPDGSGRRSNRAYPTESTNSVAENAFYNGGVNTKEYAVNAQAYINIDIMEGLRWQTKAGVNYADHMSKNHQYNTPSYFYQKDPGAEDFTRDNEGGSKKLGLTDNYNKSVLPTLFSTLNYENQLNENHRINVLAGYEQQSYRYNYISGFRQTFPTNDLKELDAGASDGQTVSGSSNEWALRSFFGRANYAFRDKYLLEANVRYDGTSRVSPQNRWGVFPSASVGWRVSEENFMKFSWLNNLKIRASLGKLGNQEIGLYPYQDILNLTNYPFGSSVDQGVLLTRMTDKNLKWETTTALDIGLDFTIYNGMFDVTLDWFKKNTTDILTTLPVPESLGLSGPVTNDGELQNTGWEVALTHKKQIGEFYYSANFMFSSFKNELTSIAVPTKGEREVGLPYNSHYIYEWIGIMQSEEEIANSPEQVFFPPSPGDLKIKDQNGDNIVNQEDRISISPYPDFTYSFGVNTEWKGFGLSLFFQGSQGNKMKLNGWGWDPFVQGDPPTTRFYDAWTPENPSNTVPAIYNGWGYGGVSAYPSTYWLHDLSYLRLKNVKLSYTLPESLLAKIKLRGVTVYISGDNLLTFTKFEGADPETLGNGGGVGGTRRYAQYPQVRIVNTGINIKL